MSSKVINVSKVIAELFPAEVTLPGGEFVRRAKVFVTELGVVVLAQEGQDIRIVHRSRHTSPPELPEMRLQQRHRVLVAHVEDGDIIARGGLGCACTMRALQRTSYADVEHMLDPTPR